MGRFVQLLVASGLLVLATSAAGQRWDAFPTRPAGERVGVAPSLDGAEFDELRRCLRDFDSEVGARYFAAVVEVSSPSGSRSPDAADGDAVPYADALFEDWGLERERDVLLVMASANRAVAIHPGERWADLGFERGAITRTIDASSFGRLASRGDLAGALCALTETVDRQLALLQTRGASPERALPPPPIVPPPTLPAARPARGGSPWPSLVVLLFLAVVTLVLWRWRRHRRARREAETELARWDERLPNAAERLLALENAHPYYFDAGAGRYAGESGALDRRTADAVNRLFLLYGKARELHDAARRRVEHAPPLAVEPYGEALRLLRDEPVAFDTGEAEAERRIFLPLERGYRGTAASLLEDLDRTYGEALELLEQVAAMQRRVGERGVAAGETVTRVQRAIAERETLGLRTDHLVTALAPLRDERDRAAELASRDPLAAGAAYEALLAQLEPLAERAAAGNGAIARLRGELAERGRELRAEVERLRAAELRLEEPGFDPDLRLDHGNLEAERIERLVAAGDEEAAVELLKRLEQGLGELGEQLAASERARDELPAAVADLAARRRELADRIPGARRILDALAAEHAADSFRAEADNLDELRAALDEIASLEERIAEGHREERYLAALADLEVAEERVADGTRLVDEIGERERRLAAARDETRELASGIRELLDRLAALAAGTAPAAAAAQGDVVAADDNPLADSTAAVATAVSGAGGLGELRAEIAAAPAVAEPLLARVREPRPHWLELAAAAARERARLETLADQAAAAVAAHREAVAATDRLAGELAALDREVAAESRDRPHVAMAVAGVRDRLEQLRGRLHQSGASGPALVAEAEAVTRALGEARRTFIAELELVQAAEGRLESARSLYHSTRGRSFGHGVVADPVAAGSLLAEAESAARERRWDRVLELAQRAELVAENERRRAEQAAAAARAAEERKWAMIAAAAMSSRRGRSSSSWSGGGRPSIATSRSSFGSRTGRPSRSGGSRWGGGGSRSGGSRW